MSDQGTVKAVHVVVHGFVQGVGYRYFVLRRAQALGLRGWVRNLYDGTVEVVAEGPEPQLQQLLDALSRGPQGSRVTRVETLWDAPKGQFTHFLIR